METLLADKVAVVTGGSRGIGLAVTRALAAEGAHVVVGARSTTTLDGLAGVTGMELDLAEASAPAETRAASRGRAWSRRCAHQQRRRRAPTAQRIPGDDGPRLRRGDATEFLHRCSSIAPRWRTWSPGAPAHREHRLCQCVLPTDGNTVDYGAAKAALVNLTKSLAQEFGHAACTSTLFHPGRQHRLVARRQRRAATVGRSLGVDADTRGSRSSRNGRYPHRAIHHTRRSSDSRRAARIRTDSQRDRRQLRDRWRPDQDHLRTPAHSHKQEKTP